MPWRASNSTFRHCLTFCRRAGLKSNPRSRIGARHCGQRYAVEDPIHRLNCFRHEKQTKWALY